MKKYIWMLLFLISGLYVATGLWAKITHETGSMLPSAIVSIVGAIASLQLAASCFKSKPITTSLKVMSSLVGLVLALVGCLFLILIFLSGLAKPW